MRSQEIYEEATRKQLGSNPNGTRHEVVLFAIELAQKEAWNEAINTAANLVTVVPHESNPLNLQQANKQSILNLLK